MDGARWWLVALVMGLGILAGEGGLLQAQNTAGSEVVSSTDGIKVEKDIAYLGEERTEKMDAYLPPPEVMRPVPAVIWIHGGGWKGGDKGEKREKNIGQTLAANGYAVFSINYKLGYLAPRKPEEKAEEGLVRQEQDVIPWPQNFYDCKSAMRFLRKEAVRFGIDPKRIAVAGGSAGGHLALLVGLTGAVPEMNRGGLYTEYDNGVSCIIDFYGVAEVQAPKWAKQFAGTTAAETEANVKAASASTYLAKGVPPIFVAHGDKDGLVPVTYSRKLVKALDDAGVAHEYVEVPGGPHSFDLQPEGADLRPVVLEFLRRYMSRPGS